MRYLDCLSFEVPQGIPFRYVTHENLGKTEESIRKEILVCLIKLVRLHIRSQRRVFPFSFWPLVLRLVPDKDFLHKKINKKEVYVDYGSSEDVPEDACSLRPYGDLTALN